MKTRLRELVVIIVALSLCACATTQSYRPSSNKISGLPNGQDIELLFVSGKAIKTKYRQLEDGIVKTDAGDFPEADIRRVEVREKNSGGTAVLIGIAVVGVFALLIGKAGEATGCAAAQEVGGACD